VAQHCQVAALQVCRSSPVVCASYQTYRGCQQASMQPLCASYRCAAPPRAQGWLDARLRLIPSVARALASSLRPSPSSNLPSSSLPSSSFPSSSACHPSVLHPLSSSVLHPSFLHLAFLHPSFLHPSFLHPSFLHQSSAEALATTPVATPGKLCCRRPVRPRSARNASRLAYGFPVAGSTYLAGALLTTQRWGAG